MGKPRVTKEGVIVAKTAAPLIASAQFLMTLWERRAIEGGAGIIAWQFE